VLRLLNCDATCGRSLLALCALVVLLALTGEAGRTLLRYDRAALASGELWRLVTAHLVHLDLHLVHLYLHHALLNCLGLLLMWVLFARDYPPRQWLFVVLASMAAIDAGLALWDSTLRWYVGSSGVLHGVMAAGTLAHLRRRERDGWLLAAFLLGKLLWEQGVGALPLSGSDPVVVDAHLFGPAGGLAAAAFLKGAREPL
jgi:rhomboid family GlyGly-CTERM serine protease